MTERGMAHSDGAPACPFVAFEDDRDERSDRPDHRHRCYAEVHPAPRAIAHQEAYCLSSAFAVCPTFQDWAHREAARTRGGAGAASTPPRPAARVTAAASDDEARPEAPAAGRDRDDAPAERWAEPAAEWQGSRPVRDEGPTPLPPRRNPPRDWAAPPPWAGSPGPGGAAAAGGAGPVGPGAGEPPRSVGDRESRGLAGSPADRLAGGGSFAPDADEPPEVAPREPIRRADPWTPSRSEERAQPPDEELAGLVGPRGRERDARPGAGAGERERDTGRYRSDDEGPARRDPTREPNHDGPSWEHPRRYEAYPTIKSRAAMPGLPRLGIMAAALGIAALALFFLPAALGLFGNGGGGGPGGVVTSPTPSAAVEPASPSPTVPPEPTPQVYVVKSGDTMSKIADRFNVSLDELLAANEETIKDPDKISIGDRVIIPVPAEDGLDGG